MGRHRTAEPPRTPLLGWGLFATALTCGLLLWRRQPLGHVLALGALGVCLSLALWVVEARARGRFGDPDPDAAAPRLHDRRGGPGAPPPELHGDGS